MDNVYEKSYEIPKALFTMELYRDMSIKAKMLYGLLLDRMKRDIEAGTAKRDEEGYLYITFPQKEVKQILQIEAQTTSKIFRELEERYLIGRVRIGMGNPDQIYVQELIGDTWTNDFQEAIDNARTDDEGET